MKLPVHVQFHGMKPSDALILSAREQAHQLESLASDIIACRVGIDIAHRHSQQGYPFGVHIDLTLPGHELIVNRVQQDDVSTALLEAFGSMRRQLHDLSRKRRGLF